jgi:hypothetical protein
MIAALYIDARGPYPRMPDVDAWGEVRDARRYAGPFPVVAHPPCGPWGNLRHLATVSATDAMKSCGPIAVEQVRAFGGVLEQPRGSKLWERCGIPKPGEPPDAWGGVSIEVAQVDWGHVARKRTWLYLVGCVMPTKFPPPREPTHWVSGGRSHDRKGSGGVVPPGIKVCSAQQRRRTPPAFAAWLVDLARSTRVDLAPSQEAA